MKITKQVSIDAAHRLIHHQGKCRSLHGHRYVFEVELEGEILDGSGVVVDFGVVKLMLNRLVGHWDHKTLLNEVDDLVDVLENAGQPVCTFSMDPTAEVLARVLFKDIERELVGLLGAGVVEVTYVSCYETPTCWATYP